MTNIVLYINISGRGHIPMVKEYLSKHKIRANKRVLILIFGLILISVLLFYFNNLNSINYNQSSNSGIVGKVLLGPISPVVREGDKMPNEKLYPHATILVKDSEGRKTITQFTSDENGEFKINLSPGVYKLEPQTPKGSALPIGSSQTVEIKPGGFTNVTINYDSGIR